MKALLDANVLYPTILREILMGCAEAGLFVPLWSPRILEEWARATRKLGPGAEVRARAEIAGLRDRWPRSEVEPHGADLARLVLPDADDVHVLAAAIAGSAEVIVTMNARDFPRGLLAEEGLRRVDADQLLRGLWAEAPGAVAAAVGAVLTRAEALSGGPLDRRDLMRRARLPRLGKALKV